MKNLFFLSVFTSLLFISGCSEQPNGFIKLCDQFEQLKSITNYQDMTSTDRFNWILDKLVNETGKDSNVTLAWSAIGNAPPEARYSLLVETSSSVGVENWSCPAAESIVHEVGVSN